MYTQSKKPRKNRSTIEKSVAKKRVEPISEDLRIMQLMTYKHYETNSYERDHKVDGNTTEALAKQKHSQRLNQSNINTIIKEEFIRGRLEKKHKLLTDEDADKLDYKNRIELLKASFTESQENKVSVGKDSGESRWHTEYKGAGARNDEANYNSINSLSECELTYNVYYEKKDAGDRVLWISKFHVSGKK